MYHFQLLAFQVTGNTPEMSKKLSRKLKGLAHALTKVSYARELESWAVHAEKENNNNYRKKLRVVSTNKNGWYKSHYN